MPVLKDGKYSYSFPSDIKYLEIAEQNIVKVAEECGFNSSDVDDICIAATEIINNAIHHGNKDDKSKNVLLMIQVSDDIFRLVVRDEGDGFDPAEIKDPLSPENLLSEGGRGVYLAHNLMDRVEYNKLDIGVEAVIEKKRSK
jgi:serine/threonine-protein kinase RsbW